MASILFLYLGVIQACFVTLIANGVEQALPPETKITDVSIQDIVIFVNNDNSKSSKGKAESLRLKILNQAKKIENGVIDVVMAHDKGIPYGYWSILPVIPFLLENFGNGKKWFYFCEDSTDLRLSRILKVLSTFDSSQELFLGHALHDTHPVIIHHYHFVKNPNFDFPDFDAGWAVSAVLMKRLAQRLTSMVNKMDFTIDVKHEIAIFLYDDGKGVRLTNVPEFCTHQPLRGTNCASTVQRVVPTCGQTHKEEILIAVKTCEKFHQDRVPVVQRTVGQHTPFIRYYSDVVDESIPTEYIGVENTERGHCQKLFNIIETFHRNFDTFKWLVVIDDDTIMNFKRLQRLLACYDSSDAILLGERYGYGLSQGYGYEYITGGGGMILSREGVRRLLESQCRCSSADAPDDMWLGSCFRRMGIPQVPSKSFHQAQPSAYSEDMLRHRYLVSFHKHSNLDPIRDVYMKYLDGGAEEPLWGSSSHPQRDEL